MHAGIECSFFRRMGAMNDDADVYSNSPIFWALYGGVTTQLLVGHLPRRWLAALCDKGRGGSFNCVQIWGTTMDLQYLKSRSLL